MGSFFFLCSIFFSGGGGGWGLHFESCPLFRRQRALLESPFAITQDDRCLLLLPILAGTLSGVLVDHCSSKPHGSICSIFRLCL